ncbi:MAG: hypothetical protein ABIJ59_08325 [Pseudomonadota bacterium]
MEKRLILYSFLILFFTITANAEQPEKPFNVNVGFTTYHHEYEEPGIMQNKGFFYGIAYSAMYEKSILLGVEGLISYGQVDYSSNSSGESDDIDDICLETRALVGYAVLNDTRVKITPFTGIAYRFLQDDSSNELTTTNNIGYLRESNYVYSPFGIKIDMPLNDGWHLKPAFEYDLFWFGEQESYLGYVAGYEDITNDQESGYGWRASLALTKKTRAVGYGVELFYRYWDIDDSEITRDRFGRSWIEPDNETSEIGLNLSILF